MCAPCPALLHCNNPLYHMLKCDPVTKNYLENSSNFWSQPKKKDGRGYVSTLPTCAPLLIFVPPLSSVEDPVDGRGCVANPPIYGPLLICPPF